MAAKKKTVEVEETPVVEEVTVEEIIEEVKKAGLKGCERLNLRKAAKLDSDVVMVLENGANIEVVENKGEWTKVKVSGKNGFVMSQFIEVV